MAIPATTAPPHKIQETPHVFTAVISDLHLCESEPDHEPGNLWKKFKTKRFFFDQEFSDFLDHLEASADGHEIELILNGDIFDFDGVMSIPEHPSFATSWLERARGLHSEEEKSDFKINRILDEHPLWVKALRNFLLKGHRVVFVIGNHDLELHFFDVQKSILNRLELPEELLKNLRFCSWFYISNEDTLIEHGNQYDPYCMCIDPINPRVIKGNKIIMRLPFGNLASRYMINGMGFFNPHVDANFIMTINEYASFFFKYMLRTQPLLPLTWLWGSVITLYQTFIDGLRPQIKDPLRVEDRIEYIAKMANTTPRVVRELRELFVVPASNNPFLIARELWLDRAFLILLGFFGAFKIMSVIKLAFDVSAFWTFIPLALLVPFFLFYAKSITSSVAIYKEPNDLIMSMASQITGVSRIIYGHTHIIRHEMIGPVEHLNSGCWSPAFLDVECTRPFGKKTFVWIEPSESGRRIASLKEFKGGRSIEAFRRSTKHNAA